MVVDAHGLNCVDYLFFINTHLVLISTLLNEQTFLIKTLDKNGFSTINLQDCTY